MLTIDYVIFALFVVVGGCLLIGMSKKEKRWFGGIGGLMASIFIVVSQIIKLQSGLFEERTVESSEPVGQWVVPFFIVLGLYLLAMINYRWIKFALTKQSWQKWVFICLDILFSFIYLLFGSFALFIVVFSYFPFAP
ncbi:hypothetical protein [Halalkalibacter okhensis]|uniref:Uncharacterized protein n=1 Tax=Halalkalibacter okhensis TaxID=333138 RepID=A0A0B0IGH8_9BACI|nr:hypothetical protein [Halalkalibacter okhensis]KHF41708.1 hypothetical protein LQ50_03125 [Halalkalibacter okhensis]